MWKSGRDNDKQFCNQLFQPVISSCLLNILIYSHFISFISSFKSILKWTTGQGWEELCQAVESNFCLPIYIKAVCESLVIWFSTFEPNWKTNSTSIFMNKFKTLKQTKKHLFCFKIVSMLCFNKFVIGNSPYQALITLDRFNKLCYQTGWQQMWISLLLSCKSKNIITLQLLTPVEGCHPKRCWSHISASAVVTSIVIIAVISSSGVEKMCVSTPLIHMFACVLSRISQSLVCRLCEAQSHYFKCFPGRGTQRDGQR